MEHKELRNILDDFFRFFSTYTLMILLVLFIGSLKEILFSLSELAFVTDQSHRMRKKSDQGTEGLGGTGTLVLTLDSCVSDAVTSRWKDTKPGEHRLKSLALSSRPPPYCSSWTELLHLSWEMAGGGWVLGVLSPHLVARALLRSPSLH